MLKKMINELLFKMAQETAKGAILILMLKEMWFDIRKRYSKR